jgi:hypothetical protein
VLSLFNEEIKAYGGERNSNLKTEGLDSISKKALDLMIEDKKEEEKLIQYSQYRKKGLLSDISLYGASFLGQMIDPISVFTGVGIEAAAAKNSVTMRAHAEPTAPNTPPAIVPNAMFTTLSSTE